MFLHLISKACFTVFAAGLEETRCELLDFLDNLGSNLQKEGIACWLCLIE